MEKNKKLQHIFNELFLKYYSDIEQVFIDFLEEIDYSLKEIKSDSQLEDFLNKIQEKSKSFSRKYLEIQDLNFLDELEEIRYSQL